MSKCNPPVVRLSSLQPAVINVLTLPLPLITAACHCPPLLVHF